MKTTDIVTAGLFYDWLLETCPELVPPGFGQKSISSDSFNELGRKVGFRFILPHESLSQVIVEIVDHIKRSYLNSPIILAVPFWSVVKVPKAVRWFERFRAVKGCVR